MKVIQLKLYTFKELGKQAKEKALTKFRYLNVDFNWWNDEYEDFIELCSYLGVIVIKDSIKFSGFYAQGDGSAFSADVDIIKLRNAIRTEAWRSYAPSQDFKFRELNADRRVLRLIERGLLPGEPQIIARYRTYGIVTDLGISVVNENRSHDLVFDELDKVEEWLRTIAETLNRYLFKTLEYQYEFLTSDTTVKESLLMNEYLFTADGRAARHLEELAKNRK